MHFYIWKKLLVIVFFFISINKVSSQTHKIIYYKNGQSGIEFIYKNKLGTVIISTYHAKLEIKDNITKKFFEYFSKNSNLNDSIIKIIGDKAIVTGKCKILKKEKLTNVNFYYQKIEWNNGITEIKID